MTVADELAALAKLDTVALIERYVALHGRDPRSKRREDVFRRCAWTLQERALGGLSATARTKLDGLIADLAPFGTAPVTTAKNGMRVGTEITRVWRDRTLRLTVRDGGFELDGVLHDSLSAAAFAVTGTRWSGPAFWGTKERSR